MNHRQVSVTTSRSLVVGKMCNTSGKRGGGGGGGESKFKAGNIQMNCLQSQEDACLLQLKHLKRAS